MGMGLQNVYRLKHSDTHSATGGWNAIMQQMAKRLNIKQKVELLESGAAKVPMVIGNLKPVILMPIGLLTALNTAEVEAILIGRPLLHLPVLLPATLISERRRLRQRRLSTII